MPEVDKLTLKTELLERQQQELSEDSQKQKTKQATILSCIGIYLVTFAVLMFIHFVSWSNDFLWNTFPGFTMPIIVLFIATAIAIAVCLRQSKSGKDFQ